MRLNLWRREVAVRVAESEGVRERALLGGLLGGGNSATPTTSSSIDLPASASASKSAAAQTTAPPSTDGSLLGGVGGAVGGLLSPIVGASSDGGLLGGLEVGPSSKPLLSVAIAPSSGPLIAASVGPVSVAVEPTGTLLGVGVGPSSSPLLSVGVAPLASSAPLIGVGSGPALSTSSSVASSVPTASSSISKSSSAGVSVSLTTASSTSLVQSSVTSQPSSVISIAQARPSTITPSTLLTSVIAASDTSPSSSAANSIGSNDGATGGVDSAIGANMNGISQSSGGTSMTTIIVISVSSVGGVAIFLGLVFLIRRMFRKRRVGRAESPPSSPLLPPMEDSMLPPSIARSISQRSKASKNNSFDWGRKEGRRDLGSNVQPLKFGNGEGFGDSYRGTALVSPLPPAAKVAGGRDIFADRHDLNLTSKEGRIGY